MSMKQLRIRPLESLHMGLTRLTGADLAPIAGKETVTPFPPPSTLLGLVGNILGVKISAIRGRGGWKESWIELIRRLCEKRDINSYSTEAPIIWGPLIEGRKKGSKDSRIYLPIYPNYLLDKADLEKYYDGEIGEEEIEELKVVERIGVRLSREMEKVAKVAKRGYRYKANYVAYTTSNLEEVSLVYLISVKELKEGTYTSRLGGEDRFALIEVTEPEDWVSDLYNLKGRRGFLLQPLLYSLKEEYGNTANLSQISQLRCIEKIHIPLSKGGIKRPKAVIWGLGYDEVRKLRRPYYSALPHGSLVELKEDCLRIRAVGLYSVLGYGSLLKF